MATWAFILILAAAIVFGVETYLRKSLIALGLCLLSAGLIVQFASTTHPFTL